MGEQAPSHPPRLSVEEWQAFQAQARALGFLDIAAAPKAPVARADAVRDWVRQGFHADMAWFERALEKRLDLDLVLEGASSVIVLTTPYTSEPVTVGGYKLARYAAGDDYHDVLKPLLWTLIEWLKARYPEVECRPYVDTGPVLERHWAEQAGLGWIGKNGCLISRESGSYLFLACIVTTAVVPYGQAHAPFCGNCTACLDACPTDAIVAPGVVDSRACISYMTIEHRGDFEDAPDFDGWIFGCDVCQEVCPWVRKFSRDEVLPAFRPRPVYRETDAATLAGQEQMDFSTLFRKSPVKRTKMAGIKRNLAHLEDSEDAGSSRS